MIYGGFEIQSFEAGRGLWHARIQRTDQAPVVIDGMAFPTLEVEMCGWMYRLRNDVRALGCVPWRDGDWKRTDCWPMWRCDADRIRSCGVAQPSS